MRDLMLDDGRKYSIWDVHISAGQQQAEVVDLTWTEIVTRCENFPQIANEKDMHCHPILADGRFLGGVVVNSTRGKVLTRTVATIETDSFEKSSDAQIWGEHFFERITTQPGGDLRAACFWCLLPADMSRVLVIFPLERPVDEGEYEHLLRQLASCKSVGAIDFCCRKNKVGAWTDWPYQTKGIPYIYKVQDGPPINVDAWLAQSPHSRIPTWQKDLWRNAKGDIKPTRDNIVRILQNDPLLCGKIKMNAFSNTREKEMGFLGSPRGGRWTDADHAQIRLYLEHFYSIDRPRSVADALEIVFSQNNVHPVREYLQGLRWDGVERLPTLIIEALGAVDNPTTRAMTSKHFVGAVARIMHPGVKYDQCLILQGPQGAGKSSFIQTMAVHADWFSDSVPNLNGGRDTVEALTGKWLVELGELAAMKRSEVEQVKSFLSRQCDDVRLAYARETSHLDRQCVFFATTNSPTFLRDETGGRRFWIIPIDPGLRKWGTIKETIQLLEMHRDQIWAEAYQLFICGEELFLTGDTKDEAVQRQRECNDSVDDLIRPELDKFLETLLPEDWGARKTESRRFWLQCPEESRSPCGTKQRQRFAAIEFLEEVWGIQRNHKDYKPLCRRVNAFMREKPDWHEVQKTHHCDKVYGSQRGFVRKT